MAATLLFACYAIAGPNEDLFKAIDAGDVAKAERAREKKANPEARDAKRRNVTALMLAELGRACALWFQTRPATIRNTSARVPRRHPLQNDWALR
jgi:hypothetical protein